jgi:hypothetical protein
MQTKYEVLQFEIIPPFFYELENKLGVSIASDFVCENVVNTYCKLLIFGDFVGFEITFVKLKKTNKENQFKSIMKYQQDTFSVNFYPNNHLTVKIIDQFININFTLKENVKNFNLNFISFP